MVVPREVATLGGLTSNSALSDKCPQGPPRNKLTLSPLEVTRLGPSQNKSAGT